MKMRTAIVGLGKMGLLHTSILSTFPNIQIVALCDKSKPITKFAKKIFEKIKILNSVELLRNFDLDIIYVTTPIPSHFKIVDIVYSYGIAQNVFVEKTLASSSVEANKLCRLARTSKGINMVGYERRYAVTFGKAHELIHRGAIGDLTSFKAYAYSSDFIGLKGEKALKVSALRGGLLRDLGAHAVDLASWYFGDLKVILHEVKLEASEGFEETIGFAVQEINGIEGHIEVSWCKEGYRMPEIGLMVEGSSGALLVNDDKVEVNSSDGNARTWHRQDLNDNVDFLLGVPEYYREDDYFVKCITKGELANPDFLEASKVDYMIEQVSRELC